MDQLEENIINKRLEDTEKEMYKALNAIFKKNIEQLLPEEIGFLRARRTYLTKAQLETYAEILEPKKSKKEDK